MTTDSTDPTTPTDPAAPEPVEPPPAATTPSEPPPEPESRQDAGDEPLGEPGVKALQRERKAAEEATAEAERLREQAEIDRARIRELEVAELRRGVAVEKRLTPEQAELLVGEDAEQLSAYADRLLAAFAPPSRDPSRRPVEALRPGTGITISEAPSASDIATDVLKG